MTDQGMDDIVCQKWNEFEQFVETDGETGGCLSDQLSVLVLHFGEQFHDVVFNCEGSGQGYTPGEFGLKYVHAFSKRYADNPSTRVFLQNLAEQSGSESIDNFFGAGRCRTHKLGLGNEKIYPGAGDIGKRIREAMRCQPASTPRRGGAGGGGETAESYVSLFLFPLCRHIILTLHIHHSF